MFIEIVDSLRCPNDHAESWLVASCDRMDHRDIIEGRLGCPVCKAEYAIRNGAVWFDRPPPAPASDHASETEALRIAAFLNLTDASGFAILEGRWTVHAPLVSALAPTPLVLLNPETPIPPQPGISVVYAGRRPPFALDCARAIAIDATARLSDVLKPGGRAVGRSTLAVPAGLTEIVQDASIWVAEKEPNTVRVSLVGRARGPSSPK